MEQPGEVFPRHRAIFFGRNKQSSERESFGVVGGNKGKFVPRSIDDLPRSKSGSSSDPHGLISASEIWMPIVTMP